MKLSISSSPHIRKPGNKNRIMGLVLIALLPSSFAGVYFFGINAFLVILVSVLTAWATDIAMQFLTKNHHYIVNLSSILTGLLLALVLPPTVPLWIPLLGAIIAVSLGKYAFGLGNSIFNPALVARAILVLSWPKLMSTWISPDGVSSATPLAGSKSFGISTLFIGDVGGCIGETSAIALLIGGAFLLITNIIDWRIPFFYISSFAALTFVFGGDPVFQMLAGGLMIGAFFMATDYVTMPITNKGRIIFALGCGILTFLFRFYSSMPEGVMYSILLMNAVSPLIERLTLPKPFGFKEVKG